eukprot:CAMPEP_0113318536 /NCGR_PEP_ID=MMETSP0010_2-20120614/13069_1 /TAXON_ID=216773 ORGANISM="Corethron hystrix, Strain 308" /NCGR_SAMPLE_ID=MMETSP0010_2 /ASSEMBLY_ACC=CAM_ASM_000155 /LENGTH=419 /DNA_ID=CAMNT_0000175865 /DNA_START=289 /DNA_END=1548 /DNA_ORIENTATION=+ /assembly_acc=CAM_ASM_000155
MGRRALSMSSFEEVTTFSMHLSTSLPDLTIEDIGSISSTYIFDDKGGGMNENEINKPKIYTEHMIVENLNLICDKNVSNTKGKQQSVMILPDLTLEDTESIASTDVSDDDEDFIEIYEPKTCHTSKEKSFAEILNVSSITGQRKTRPIICGHRGSIYKEPENTLAGFLKAIEIGVDAVEFDVFLLKCGTLVVFHGAGGDENPGLLDDNIGIEGSILDYTAEEARKLSFNSNGEEFGCPKDRIDAPSAFIPTLKEVLEVLKGTGVIAKIELKGPGTAEPVLELVESMEMTDQCHYSSFDHSRIARIRELRPERNSDGTYIYRTGALFVDPPYNFISLSLAVGASEVHLRYDTCTKERVDAIHANGMGSLAWWRGPPGMLKDVTEKYLDVGNEDESMYRIAMKTGVDVMCVNKPDVLAKMH